MANDPERSPSCIFYPEMRFYGRTNAIEFCLHRLVGLPSVRETPTAKDFMDVLGRHRSPDRMTSALESIVKLAPLPTSSWPDQGSAHNALGGILEWMQLRVCASRVDAAFFACSLLENVLWRQEKPLASPASSMETTSTTESSTGGSALV